MESRFLTVFRVRLKAVMEREGEPWDLLRFSPLMRDMRQLLELPHPPITEFLESLQGVTWGGEKMEQVYVLSTERIKELGFESDVIYKGLKGRDIEPWAIRWDGRFFLYPYLRDPTTGTYERAFRRMGIPADSLDFSVLSSGEQRIVRNEGGLVPSLSKLLTHRIARGMVRFPRVAKYLIEHYMELSDRIFEGKKITEYGKMWYEYHRPRVPEKMLYTPKIVTPRLNKRVKFALDTEGYLPQDSVIALVPKSREREGDSTS